MVRLISLIAVFSLFPIMVRADDSPPIYARSGEVHVAVPDRSWEIIFPKQEWNLLQLKMSADHSSYNVLLMNGPGRISASFFVEPAVKCSTSEDCREFFWSNPGPGYQGGEGFERFDQNGFSIMKCYVPIAIGALKRRQLNFSAHMVRNGYWIDMHIAKEPADKGDEKIISDFVGSIRLHVR